MPSEPKKPEPAGSVRVRLDLSADVHAALSIVAGYRKLPMSAVAREAVTEYVEREIKRIKAKP